LKIQYKIKFKISRIKRTRYAYLYVYLYIYIYIYIYVRICMVCISSGSFRDFSQLYWQIPGHLVFSRTVLEKFYVLRQVPGICHMNTMTDPESLYLNVYTTFRWMYIHFPFFGRFQDIWYIEMYIHYYIIITKKFDFSFDEFCNHFMIRHWLDSSARRIIKRLQN